MTLTFDLLTLKVVSESRVTWAISMPILVFLGFSVLDLGPMYATNRQRHLQSVLNAAARLVFRLRRYDPHHRCSRNASPVASA